MTREERFWSKVKRGALDECWPWLAYVREDGYARFDGKEYVHRFAYEQVVGLIPEGLQIDHLCRNRSCVNPAHLEPVTQQENIRRGELNVVNRSKTYCPQGHPYSDENTYRSPNRPNNRMCRACRRERDRATKKAARVRSCVP